MILTPELINDLRVRRDRLQESMQQMGVDACLLCTNVNIFYVAGVVYTGYCYLPAEGDPIHFVKSPQSGLPIEWVPIRKPEQLADLLSERGLPRPRTMLMETDVVAYSHMARLLEAFGLAGAQNASAWMRRMRSVKTDYEITQVRQTARSHENVYAQIPSVYKPGMTDLQLQIEIERLMRRAGSVGIFRGYGDNTEIFMGSLLVGDNAQAPSPFDFALGGEGISPIVPLGANGTPIKDGQSIMVDMAGNYGPWFTDMTRVFSAGRLPDQALKAHQVSIDIHEAVLEKAAAGFPCSEMYGIAARLAEKAGLAPNFMGTKQQAKFVGHGLGLEINEPPVLTPRSQEVLEPGIVFALEPKFVLPGVGAVGIENTYLVTQNGVEKITLCEEQIIELA